MFDETSSRSFDFTQVLEDSPSRPDFDFVSALDEKREDPRQPRFPNLPRFPDERVTDGLGTMRSWSEAGTGDETYLREEEAASEEPVEAETASSLSSKKEKLISVEGMKIALKSYLSSWFDKNRVQIFANLGGGAAVGFLANMCFTELIAQNRQMAAFLPDLITHLQGSSILVTNMAEASAVGALAMRGKEELLEKHLKAASFAKQLAVSRSADNLIDRILIIGSTSAKSVRGIALHPGTMGFVSGAWLYAALSGAGVFGESGLTNQAHAVSPADSGGAGAGGEQAGGNLDQPDIESLRARGKIEIPTLSDGQPPAGGGVGPDANPLTTPDAPTIKPPLDPAGLESFPPTTDPAEAARIVALNEGQTVEQIMAAMPQQQQTVSEAILKIIGDIPHGGEITNVIYRAAGEDDVGKLHEGAIRALANSLSDLFSKADVAANNFGVPYDKGVLNAVNNTQSLGPNSSVANIIKAGNLGDMEAAAKIREEVFKPILQVLAK